MGNRLTEEDEQPAQTGTPYGNIFDELFPHYLVMGMTPEEYWDGESSLKPAYRAAYRIRLENEERLADRQNWYMGQYIMMALQAVPLLVNGFVPKGTEPGEYPDKPFFEKFEEQKKEEAKKQKEEDQMKLAMAMFQQFAKNMNRNIDRKASAGQ